MLAKRFRQLRAHLGGFRVSNARPLKLGYIMGAVASAYSLTTLLYELNIDFASIVELPFLTWFRQELLPFIASPFSYIGLDLTTTWQVLLAFSGIGASSFVNAGFRTRWRALRHFFVKKEGGPRFDRSAVGKPPKYDTDPTHPVLSRIFVVVVATLLGYSFVGLVGFLVLLVFGAHAYYRDLKYLGAVVMSNAFLVAERLVRPYDKLNDHEHWGTRWTTYLFPRRRDLNDYIRDRYGPTVESIRPEHRNWNASRSAIEDGARVVANTVWIMLCAACVGHLFA